MGGKAPSTLYKMFSLFYGLWTYLFHQAELHLLIVGLDDAGKTTLLEQLKELFGNKRGIPLDKIPPTVGLNIAKVHVQRSRVIFWDLGGQERLRAIWDKYYSESHGLVFVIDSANASRFEEAKETLHQMLSNQELQDIPLLVLANKMDLDDAKDIKSITSMLDTSSHSGPTASLPICALTKEGVSTAIQWLVDAVQTSDRYVRMQNK